MKQNICVRSISDASVTRTFIIIAILSVAAALYWSSGVAALAGPAHAAALPTGFSGETITVTTLNDVSDFSGAQQVGDLPGHDGRISFREACTAANNTPGPQTIAFAIPIAEFWLDPTVALLKLEVNAFFVNDSDTTVDFSTQTTNIGDTNPNGPEVGIYGLQPNGGGAAAIFVNGQDCVIKGLGRIYQRAYGIRLVGNNNRVIGNQITGGFNGAVLIQGYLGGSVPTGNTVGGTAAGEGNILAGVAIGGPADGNVVIGNILDSVNVQGAPRYGVIASNNRVGGPTAAERNVINGRGAFGEEGFPLGTQVTVIDAEGTVVEGNYIGTTVDGSGPQPLIGPIGVEVRDARNTTIRGNLIAGMRVVGQGHYSGQVFGEAIHVGAVNDNSATTLVVGNTIGLAANGVTPIVTRSGITVSPMTGNYHALGTRIVSNHIAGVETTGVIIGAQENGITITGNSIHDSGALGIDLFSGNFGGVGGVTLNDPGDIDIGGNGLQNFPVLLSASTTDSAVTIQGILDTSPSVEQYAVEFFSSQTCDQTGYGEGATFLGSITVTTDGSGHATFSATLPAAVAVGAQTTATATRLATGDTSEFSACLAVTAGPTQTPTPTLAPTLTPTPATTPTPTPPATPTPTLTPTPATTPTPSPIPSPRTAFDYDGDRIADMSVYRPSESAWYVLRTRDGFTVTSFGLPTDRIVPADYDGDLKTDIAVYRPSSGMWYIINSSTGGFSAVRFGISEDLPTPADYEGDGKADISVFRPSTGIWYRLSSSNGSFSAAQFGISEDKPTIGDFDGDGKADIAVYRPSTSIWYRLNSSNGAFSAAQFGMANDMVAPADYDGDGRTDLAVFRPTESNWYLSCSTYGFMGLPFGVATDIPVPADFDGDGKADIAVFRPSSATWYRLNSSDGSLIATSFGAIGDKATQSAFEY